MLGSPVGRVWVIQIVMTAGRVQAMQGGRVMYVVMVQQAAALAVLLRCCRCVGVVLAVAA